MPNLHIGNVAEFNEQYGVSADDGVRRLVREECDCYGAIAPFLSTDPGLVVLSRNGADSRWWDLLGERLRWESLQPYSVDVTMDESLCAAASKDAFVVGELSEVVNRGDQAIPWGESPSYRQLVSTLPPERASRSANAQIQAWAESKANFGTIAECALARSPDDGVKLPVTIICHSETELLDALRSVASDGARLLLKAEFGVGGFGTTVIQPEWAQTAAARQACLAGLRQSDERFTRWPVVVQEYVPRSRLTSSDLTGDAEVAHDGLVSFRSGATMLVDSTHYSGAVTACGSHFPPAVWERVRRFTLAVGEELATRGYRGWYDVDFIESLTGQLMPLELNARRTGPIVAHTIGQRVSMIHGRPVVAAVYDAFPLPRRIDDDKVFEAFAKLNSGSLYPPIPTAFLGTAASSPKIGLGVVGETALEAVACMNAAADELLRMLA